MKRMFVRRYVFSWLITLSACCSINAQNPIKDVTIASPTAAALAKYGDVPVSYHTGMPQISIPIYTVTEGSLSLPISISYHPSGLKLLEPASWVGAGWSLNAGGVISRSVNGAPDDRGFGSTSNVTHGHFSNCGFNSYLFVTGPHTGPPETSDGMVADDQNFIDGKKDGEPDMFNFNFNGYSGKFYFRDDRVPVLVPEQDIRIEPLNAGTFYIQGFIITTPDGVKYYFGKNQLSDGNIDAVEVTSPYTVDAGLTNGTCISSWYLNRIVSADSKFAIKLTYTAENYSYYTTSMFYITSNEAPEKKEYKLVKNFLQGVRLNQVFFSNGLVNFVPGAVRTDLSDYQTTSITDVENTSARVLDAVQVTNGQGMCRNYSFSYNYFVDNSTSLAGDFSIYTINTDKKRLRLDSFQEKKCDNTTTIPPYTFTYTTPVGDNAFAPRRLSFAQDHWGFYNGKTNNSTLIPTYYLNQYTVVSGADRESSWPEMSYGSLNKITYPTGGSSSFDFEANSTYVNYNVNTPTNRGTYSVGFDGNNTATVTNVSLSGNPYQLKMTNMNCSPGITNCSAFTAITNAAGTVEYARVSAAAGQTATTTVTLAAGTTYRVFSSRQAVQTGQGASTTFTELVPGTVSKNETIGGLRIKSITNYDGVSTSNNVVTRFDYNDNTTGRSNGILYSRPTYVQVMRSDIVKQVGYATMPDYRVTCSPNGCLSCDAGLIYFKSPVGIRPMATTQGNHIGYNEVKVYKTGNGYSIYRYYGSNIWDLNTSDIVTRRVDLQCSASIPNFPAAPLPFEYIRGDLKYEGSFKEGGQLIQESTYLPVYTTNAVKTPAYLINSWGPTLYELSTAKKTQSTTVTKYYSSPGVALTTTNVDYFESPFHNQVTRSVLTDSKGASKESKLKYANDYRVAACDNITDCYPAYASSAATATSTFNTQLFSCTSGSWNCQWVAWQQYRRDLSIARATYITCRRNSFLDAGNTFKTNHDNAKSSANTDLKPILELQDRFMNPPIETSVWKNTNLLSAMFTKYDYNASVAGMIYPVKTQAIRLAAPSTVFTSSATNGSGLTKDSRYTDEQLLKMTDGTIAEVTGRNGITKSYLWAYNNQYPAAEVVNAHANEIFYESFEETGTWNAVTAYDATKVHAGKKSARIDNAGPGEYFCQSTKLLPVSLSAPTKYKYSGWIFSNGPSAELVLVMKRSGETGYSSYIDGITCSTTGTWTYVEKEFLVPADVVQLNMRIDNNSTGTVWFDDIRLHPSVAQMETYTYTPLVGMTSKSDVNSRPNNYTYDAFNRLIMIRDKDNNIIKKICYNYYGQAESCE